MLYKIPISPGILQILAVLKDSQILEGCLFIYFPLHNLAFIMSKRGTPLVSTST